jgi:hypothetical protein
MWSERTSPNAGHACGRTAGRSARADAGVVWLGAGAHPGFRASHECIAHLHCSSNSPGSLSSNLARCGRVPVWSCGALRGADKVNFTAWREADRIDCEAGKRCLGKLLTERRSRVALPEGHGVCGTMFTFSPRFLIFRFVCGRARTPRMGAFPVGAPQRPSLVEPGCTQERRFT